MHDNKHFTLFEHQSLYSVEGNDPVDTYGHIGLPEKAFSELEQFILQNPDDATLFLEPSYLKPFGKTLKAQQFVGVIETCSGFVIEILPKIAKCISHEETRQIFMKMLKQLRNSPFKHFNMAHLKTEKLQLLEIFILMFCEELAVLIQKGILLKPDLKIGTSIIADTKWKLLDYSKLHNGISQSDIYQMYAYGKKYTGTKEIHLIYPQTETFPEAQSRELHFERGELQLKILPFNCKEGRIEDYGRLLEGVNSDFTRKDKSNIQENGLGFQSSEELNREPETVIC